MKAYQINFFLILTLLVCGCVDLKSNRDIIEKSLKFECEYLREGIRYQKSLFLIDTTQKSYCIFSKKKELLEKGYFDTTLSYSFSTSCIEIKKYIYRATQSFYYISKGQIYRTKQKNEDTIIYTTYYSYPSSVKCRRYKSYHSDSTAFYFLNGDFRGYLLKHLPFTRYEE